MKKIEGHDEMALSLGGLVILYMTRSSTMSCGFQCHEVTIIGANGHGLGSTD